MDQREATGFARADIRGVIEKQPIATFAALQRQSIARCNITVGNLKVPIVARNDVATQLASCLAGDSVRIKGVIVVHEAKRSMQRNGAPFLIIEAEEIVEWSHKQRKH